MEKTSLDITDLTDMVVAQQATITQLQERADALLFVVGWLLAKHPGSDAQAFLSLQANELEGNPKFVETVALLDDLREELVQWHAQWKPSHTPQQV